MKRATDTILILQMMNTHGQIHGKKRLQKIIFLLKNKHKVPFSFKFRPYFYGPYSSELSDHIDALIKHRFISERRVPLGFMINRYDYILTKKGKEYLIENAPSLENDVKSLINDKTIEMKDEPTHILVSRSKSLVFRST
ncbi:MAG: hypothetical protein ACW97G_11295 [Candidatus Thorarchaeota archaeon]|jgi:uncharacterized protein YwgA